MKIKFIRWTMFLFLQMIINVAYAFDFEIDRIRIDLTMDEPVQGIRIKNNNDKMPVNLQVSPVSWKQENGQDIYAPTNDLIVAPTVMTIPPTRSQIMRIGWRAPAPIANEIAYRIYIQQLNAAALNTRIGVQFKLSLGLPVFIKPAQPVYQFNWIVKRSGNGYSVTFQNTGNVHIQITTIDLYDSANKLLGSYKLPYYVLAKQSAEVQVPTTSSAGGSVNIMASTDYKPIVSQVNVS